MVICIWYISYSTVLLIDITQPHSYLQCEHTSVVATPVSCSIEFSEEVEDVTKNCIDISKDIRITSFRQTHNPLVYSFFIESEEDGDVTLFVKDNQVKDHCGNWNSRSNFITIHIGMCFFLILSYLDSIIFKPTLSSPYSSSHSSYSPYYIPILVELPSNTDIVNASLISVNDGVISDLYKLNSQWSFSISPYHQGRITVQCLAGAFIDEVGRISKQSDPFILDIAYDTVECLFLGPGIATDILVLVTVVCERFLPVNTNDFFISNGTIQSLEPIEEEDRYNIYIKSTKNRVDVIINFSSSFRIENGVSSSNLIVYVNYDSSLSPIDISNITTSSSTTCQLHSTPLLISHTTVYEVTITCSKTVSSISSKWLTADSFLYHYEGQNEKIHSAYVFQRYGSSEVINLAVGAFYDQDGFVSSNSSCTLSVQSDQPKITLSIPQQRVLSTKIQIHAVFDQPCIINSISSSVLQYQGSCINYSVDLTQKKETTADFLISALAPCYLYVTFKGGSILSKSQPSRYNIASNTVKLDFVVSTFSFTSTIDDQTAVYSNEITFRLIAAGKVNSIMQSDIITTNCDIESFITGFISPNTVVEIKISIPQEGEFSLQIPEGEIFLETGNSNLPWMVTLEYVIDKGNPSVMVRKLQDSNYINKPFILDFTFSFPVYELNDTCIETENIDNLQIVDLNPYFIVHAYPKDEGTISIQLKDRMK